MLIPAQTQIPSPLVRKLGELDAEMKLVLDRSDLDDHEKALIYSQTLEKYLDVKEKLSRPVQVPLIDKNESKPIPKTTDIPAKSQIDMNIFPLQYRARAQNLLNHIEKSTSIGFNDRGEILRNGFPIAGSNIIDLVDDAVRYKKHKTETPIGSDSFVDGLLDSNVPRSLIGNKKLLERSYNTPPPSPLTELSTLEEGSHSPRARGRKRTRSKQGRKRTRSKQTGYGLLKWANL